MNEMVQKGLVEKVLVPGTRKKGQGEATIRCFRLIENDQNAQPLEHLMETENTMEDFDASCASISAFME